MPQLTVEEAGEELSKLLAEIETGEEVIITRNNIAIAKIVPLSPSKAKPQFGSAKQAIIHMADDFDAPLEDFKDY